MKVKHSCGHEVEVQAQFAPYIRRTFCDECQELAKKLQEEQCQRFNKLIWAAKDFNDKSRISAKELKEIEELDNPWVNIDYNIFNFRRN